MQGFRGSQTLPVHVPLQHFDRWACTPEHGRWRDFFQGGAKNIFAGAAKSRKITFSPLETKKTTFFCKNWWENVKFQNPGAAVASTSKAHAPETSYRKKADEDNKNIFTNKHAMICENNIQLYLF